MPRGDRTGPMGLGPMTGRGVGLCAGFPSPGYAAQGFGGGFRGGSGGRMPAGGYGGGGWGWRHRFFATGLPRWARSYEGDVPSNQETEWLKERAGQLEKQLDAINQRIKEIESEPDA
jgi:hypothetical protein